MMACEKPPLGTVRREPSSNDHHVDVPRQKAATMLSEDKTHCQTSKVSLSMFRLRFRRSDVLKFTALCGLFLALFRWIAGDLAFQVDWPLSVLYTLGVSVLCAWSVMWRRSRSPRCANCGRRMLPIPSDLKAGTCPACRVQKLSPPVRRRVGIVGLIVLTILLVALPFVLLWPFAGALENAWGRFAYPAISIGLFVAFFALVFGSLVLRLLVRMWRMSSPGHALSVARASAQEKPTEHTLGLGTVFSFGTDDPTAWLGEAIEVVRRRFAKRVGEPIKSTRPLRFFVFGRRAAFEEFVKRSLLNAGDLDGLYIPWSTRTIAITTETPENRLSDLPRVVRTLVSYFYLDAYKNCPSPIWLQAGIANELAYGGDIAELSRLNRKMLASLSRGTDLQAAELFDIRPATMIRLVNGWQDHAKFTRYVQLTRQAHSVVEFLCGDGSPEARRSCFRSFVREVRVGKLQEATFEKCFGYGFGELLARWRQWVLDKGPGIVVPPPAHVRDALRERLMPTILDEGALVMNRVQAIREMGRAGHCLGADVLIDELGTGDERLTEAATWALEMISGLDPGPDESRWRDWYRDDWDHEDPVNQGIASGSQDSRNRES
jgi:hypothetical protein